MSSDDVADDRKFSTTGAALTKPALLPSGLVSAMRAPSGRVVFNKGRMRKAQATIC